MINATENCGLAEALSRSREAPDAIDWAERAELAGLAADWMSCGEDNTVAMQLLHQLASDPKWEVRQEVAQQLLAVPEDEFSALADQLGEDCNMFVRRAVRRATAQRRRLQREASELRKENDRLARELRKLEAELGPRAMDKVMGVCGRYIDHNSRAMNHELRGTLTSLKACCHAVVSEAKPSRATARLDDIVTLLENTVTDIETFARPAQARRHQERLREVIVSAVDVAKENVRKHVPDIDDVDIPIDVSEAIVLPMARHLVLMAFANVVKNACESLAIGGNLQDGRIRIRCECPDGAIEVTVEDNGTGMAEDELAEVAQFRPGRRNKRKRYSTGYGLPIAARNLEAHGGTIAIESQEDVGTTVRITLPLKSDYEEHQDEDQRPSRRRRSTDRRGNRGRA